MNCHTPPPSKKNSRWRRTLQISEVKNVLFTLPLPPSNRSRAKLIRLLHKQAEQKMGRETCPEGGKPLKWGCSLPSLYLFNAIQPVRECACAKLPPWRHSRMRLVFVRLVVALPNKPRIAAAGWCWRNRLRDLKECTLWTKCGKNGI